MRHEKYGYQGVELNGTGGLLAPGAVPFRRRRGGRHSLGLTKS